MADADKLTQLGQAAPLPQSPEDAVIETVDNPHGDTSYVVRFSCPEFTSLCPVTGQPDFAKFAIDYLPDKRLIESKSLKLFMASFRNHAAFHEDCTVTVGKRLVEAAGPIWLRVTGMWYPRGGIPIDVFFQTGPAPKGVHIPDPPYTPYHGR
ncbi:MAG TPA: NADPH-dependent 7-cyano-7-deazaguanine reductase QueF [Rhodospirillaceae bacterium]|nr:NADPH-dependent 7-cyano-7-deazaguanine reductase QueF [Rhodospirillaceae bacterium]HAA92499.1 NADPH-dependent 7-cyano-7-deazaguanine reductase QueF [Rhodospirillaceae bacterium]HAT35299.1 NADPH-dependent 7-cyano-7-deazaguanine reductase QueF [Rhodospirillaceae bacterium]